MNGDRRESASTTFAPFKTSIGWCAVVNGPRGIVKIVIGYPSREKLCQSILDEGADTAVNVAARGEAVEKIKAYCCEYDTCLDRVAVDWSLLSAFQKRVFKAVMKVPYGEVTTYGTIAKKIGAPGASRAVGNALSNNPFPLVVPCHRVIRGDRRLGGFTAEGGIRLKKKLLHLEKLHHP